VSRDVSVIDLAVLHRAEPVRSPMRGNLRTAAGLAPARKLVLAW
jgi:hypothetical protein